MGNNKKSNFTDLDIVAIVASGAMLVVALWTFIATGAFPALLGLL